MAKSLQTNIVFNGIDQTSRVLAGIHKNINGLASSLSSMSSRLTAMGQQMSLAVSAPAGLMLKSSVDAGMEQENALDALQRATDLSGTDLAKLQKQLSVQAGDLGKSTADMMIAAATASKAGVPVAELSQMVDLSEKAALAFEMTSSDAADSLAKVKSALKLSVADLRTWSDAVNFSEDVSAASAAGIVEAWKQASGAIKVAGLDFDFATGFFAALQSAGVKAEVSANTLKSALTTLSNAPGLEKKQIEALNSLGFDAKELQVKMSVDPDAAIADVLTAINGITDKAKKTSIINTIFGKEYGDTISIAAEQLGEIKRIQDEIEKGSAKDSLEKNFVGRSKTLSFAAAQLSSSWKDLKAGIGLSLAPELKASAIALRDFTRVLADNPERMRAFGKALVGAVVVGPAILALGALAAALSNIARVAAFAMMPLVALARGMSLAAVAMFGAGKAALAARAGLLALTVPLVAVPAALAAIGIAAAGIWAGWDRIKAAFDKVDWGKMLDFAKGFGQALMKLDFDRMAVHLREMWREIEPLVSEIGKAITDQFAKVNKWLDENVPGWRNFREGVSSAIKAVGDFLTSVANLANSPALVQARQAITDFLGSVGSFVLSKAGVGLKSLSSVVERTATAINQLAANGSIKQFFADLPAPVLALASALGLLAIQKTAQMMTSLGFTIRNLGAEMLGTGTKASKMFNLLRNPGFVGPMTYAFVEAGKQMGIFGKDVDAFSIAMTATFAALALDIGASLVKAFAGTKIAAAAGTAAGAAYNLAVRTALAIGAAISAVWSALTTAAAAVAGTLAGTAYAVAARTAATVGTAISAAWSGLGTGAAAALGTAQGGAFGAAFVAGAGALIAAGIAAAIAAGVMSALQIVDPKGNLGGLTTPIDNKLREWLGRSPKDTGITPTEIWDGLWGVPEVPKIQQPDVAPIKAANDNQQLRQMQEQMRPLQIQMALAEIYKSAPKDMDAATPGAPAGSKPGESLMAIGEAKSHTAAVNRAAAASERAAVASEATSGKIDGVISAIREGNAIMSSIPGAIRGAMPWSSTNGARPGANKVSSNSVNAAGLGHR